MLRNRQELPTLAEYLPERSKSADDARDEELDVRERERWEEERDGE
jgi:hypothetical protein